MFDLFKNKIQKSWGLHISDRHIRCAEINGGGNWKISKLGKINLPENTVENGVIKNPEIFISSLQELLKNVYPSKFHSPYVIVKLAEEHTFYRTIELPEMESKEIEEAIQWEAESNIPLPLEKVYLSWEILPDKKDKKVSILLAATIREAIDSLLDVLKKVKIQALIVEPESAALVRSLAETDPELFESNPILVLNLKEHYTHIIAFHSKVVRLSTITEVSSNDFDSALQNKLKIKEEEANQIRKQVGWNESNQLYKKFIDVTSTPFNELKKEIEISLSFYRDKNGEEIKQILLTGEIKDKWPGFDKYLEKSLGLPVKWQNQWPQEKLIPNCPYVDQGEEEYNIVVGLALRKLEGEF